MYANRPVDIAPIRPGQHHSIGYSRVENSPEAQRHNNAQVADQFISNLRNLKGDNAPFAPILQQMVAPTGVRDPSVEAIRADLERTMHGPNAVAKSLRENMRQYQTNGPQGTGPVPLDLMRLSMQGGQEGAIAKANLDVGTLTNFASITGGQALGYVSLDTQIARGTIRPESFTLYSALPKSAAFQVVDYWAYVDSTGGALPGAAFTGFSNVAQGTLSTNAGVYELNNLNLKMAVDGRAVTTALMAQNNFVDVIAQENANAALSILTSVNWANYYGNPTLYPNQPLGLVNSIPAKNFFDYQQFYAANAAIQGWTSAQTLYNLIYEASAVITSYGTFGRISHAFMSPVCNGSLQTLVTTILNNIATGVREQSLMGGIIVNGDLQGMKTRMGMIQFPLDILIGARDIPPQALPNANGTTSATLTNPTPPTGISVAVSGAAYGASNWGVGVGSPYIASSGKYVYAVSSTDSLMNESVLTFATSVASGVTATGAYVVTIAPPGDTTAANFRVYRSGLGASGVGASGVPSAVRYIGTVAANGSSNVTFADGNNTIPGAETIFLLDMTEADNALDYRFLLPLTRIELFAQNLYMPWAVASIGAIRNRIPKFHGVIRNYVPDNPVFNPLAANGG